MEIKDCLNIFGIWKIRIQDKSVLEIKFMKLKKLENKMIILNIYEILLVKFLLKSYMQYFMVV